MRRFLLGSLAFLGFLSLAQSANAQIVGNFGDPFFLYYGFYLPRQQVLANQPGPEAAIGAVQQLRQEKVLVDRQGLYDTSGSSYLDEGDTFLGGRGRPSRLPRTSPSGLISTNLNGMGPPLYYNRMNNYYPSLMARARRAPRTAPGAPPPALFAAPPNRTTNMVPFPNTNVPTGR
jgi:hypothetical protein